MTIKKNRAVVSLFLVAILLAARPGTARAEGEMCTIRGEGGPCSVNPFIGGAWSGDKLGFTCKKLDDPRISYQGMCRDGNLQGLVMISRPESKQHRSEATRYLAYVDRGVVQYPMAQISRNMVASDSGRYLTGCMWANRPANSLDEEGCKSLVAAYGPTIVNQRTSTAVFAGTFDWRSIIWNGQINRQPAVAGKPPANGNGALTLPDGRRVSARFKGGAVDGAAEITYPDGGKYTGAVTDGFKRHGSGVFLDAKGNKYTGAWSNDQRDGEGIELDAAGSKYEGAWSMDKRTNGRMTMGYDTYVMRDGVLQSLVPAPSAQPAATHWVCDRGDGTFFPSSGSYGAHCKKVTDAEFAPIEELAAARHAQEVARQRAEPAPAPAPPPARAADDNSMATTLQLLSGLLQQKADERTARRANQAAAAQQAAETAARRNALAMEQQRQADLEAQERQRRQAQAEQDKKADAARRADADRQIQLSLAQAERDINARQAAARYASEQAAMRQRGEEERLRREKAEQEKQDRLDQQRRREESQRKKADDDAQFRGYSPVSGRTHVNTLQVTNGILAETATSNDTTITGTSCAEGVQVYNESGHAASVTVQVRWLQKYNCQMGSCSFRNAYDSFTIRLRSPDARMTPFPSEMQQDIRVLGPGGLICNTIYIERATVKYLD